MNETKLQVDTERTSLKVNNGFVVTDFIVATDVNFVYAKDEQGYKLLNLDTMGITDEETIIDLINSGASVAIIDKLNMDVYNLDEDILKQAMVSL